MTALITIAIILTATVIFFARIYYVQESELKLFRKNLKTTDRVSIYDGQRIYHNYKVHHVSGHNLIVYSSDPTVHGAIYPLNNVYPHDWFSDK